MSRRYSARTGELLTGRPLNSLNFSSFIPLPVQSCRFLILHFVLVVQGVKESSLLSRVSSADHSPSTCRVKPMISHAFPQLAATHGRVAWVAVSQDAFSVLKLRTYIFDSAANDADNRFAPSRLEATSLLGFTKHSAGNTFESIQAMQCCLEFLSPRPGLLSSGKWSLRPP